MTVRIARGNRVDRMDTTVDLAGRKQSYYGKKI